MGQPIGLEKQLSTVTINRVQIPLTLSVYCLVGRAIILNAKSVGGKKAIKITLHFGLSWLE